MCLRILALALALAFAPGLWAQQATSAQDTTTEEVGTASAADAGATPLASPDFEATDPETGAADVAGADIAGDVAADGEAEVELAAALDDDTPENLLDAIRQHNVLRVGLSTFIPWAMRDNQGEFMGFEVDVARKLAEDLQVELELVANSWDSIIADLDSGEYDIIVSGLSITPTRALVVDFSRPYGHSSFRLLVNKAKGGELQTLEDFNRGEITIGLRAGGVAAEIVTRELPEADHRDYPSERALFDALLAGEIHALVGVTPRPELAAATFEEVALAPVPPLAQRSEAFAVRKGNQSFLNFLNAWIEYHEADGFLDDRRHYWFHTTEWAEQM
ncbi:MAG: transporter substrate-binding domain-containing protein [Candidatus Competibacterales bacterium]